jgi:VIT1/CCC1 family predicted Fe2+/Mn2+ transporter
MTSAMAGAAARRVARDPDRLLDVMAAEEFGVDPTPHDDPRKDALAIAASFALGAGIPIAPYALAPQSAAFVASLTLASCILFAVGVFKARVIGLQPWRSGLQTFAFGAAATAVGYVVGTVLPRLFGIHAQI